MKPDLSLSFPPEWQGVPPGIPALDFLVWQNFRLQISQLFDRLYFNVRVGEPVAVDESLPPEIKAMAVALSRRRIDVVGETSSSRTLYELKYDVSTEALGQILTYQALWLLDPPDSLPISVAIVTHNSNRDIVLACKHYNVQLIVV
jgi:hypothetical protein